MRRILAQIALGISVMGLSAAWAAVPLAPPNPPSIQSLLKPEVLTHVVRDREVITHASLDSAGAAGQRYTYYAAMLVRASVRQTREVLTNYALYSKMISYIDRAKYDPATQVLELGGGIFGWRLHSWIQFEEIGDHWIRYRIIRGHFTGLSGEILFERQSPADTLVYMRGGLTAAKWPPKFIIERGAEIVFGFTARRMRSYIGEQASGHL